MLTRFISFCRGSFELKRSGSLLEICEGFQAHLSTRASCKVREVATKFPDKVKLEEVSRLSSWPLQFKKKGPTEDNIALFFFAKDVKRSALCKYIYSIHDMFAYVFFSIV